MPSEARFQQSRGATGPALDGCRFTIIGVGGLGCPILMGLVAAGAQRFRLIDHDVVDESNLQRQVLFNLSDRGRPKVDAAAEFLRKRVPGVEIETVQRRFDNEDVAKAAEERGIMIDGTDDSTLGFTMNDACMASGVRAVLAGALAWRGQVMAIAPGSACLRCVFEAPPPPELTPSCSAAGVIGSTTALVGHAAAMMAVRFCARRDVDGAQDVDARAADPAGQLFVAELQSPRLTSMHIGVRADCPAHPLGPG